MDEQSDALAYHKQGRPGKISITSTKPLATMRDLSLAYTPGVADPVLRIAEDPDAAYDYTSRGNLVAVVTNGTAILGLGNRGALAAKPVMEGKAVLFKKFAGIDAMDIEIDSEDPRVVIETVAALEPTFGGINLEDIRAPECFEIEQQLRERMSIPVFHDDQHGTAVVVGAALQNALLLAKKSIGNISVVLNGAGAAGLAIAEFLLALGVPKNQLMVCDTVGVIFEGREEHMNDFKRRFAVKTSARSLSDALRGCDVFIGVSAPNILTPEMLLSMAEHPIVFAMANPTPEISFALATATREDAIVATGRSDQPNQVNNVLCFPFIFRGALDVRASTINQQMKVAASTAIAELAREEIPPEIQKIYGDANMKFGFRCILPKPFDHRLLSRVAPEVAKAALESGVARKQIDIDHYRSTVDQFLQW